jgi:hypothetical protein
VFIGLDRADHGFGKACCALATCCPVLGDICLNALGGTKRNDPLQVCGLIVTETIDSDNRRQAE